MNLIILPCLMAFVVVRRWPCEMCPLLPACGEQAARAVQLAAVKLCRPGKSVLTTHWLQWGANARPRYFGSDYSQSPGALPLLRVSFTLGEGESGSWQIWGDPVSLTVLWLGASRISSPPLRPCRVPWCFRSYGLQE